MSIKINWKQFCSWTSIKRSLQKIQTRCFEKKISICVHWNMKHQHWTRYSTIFSIIHILFFVKRYCYMKKRSMIKNLMPFVKTWYWKWSCISNSYFCYDWWQNKNMLTQWWSFVNCVVFEIKCWKKKFIRKIENHWWKTYCKWFRRFRDNKKRFN